jgi:hypothetical protein
MLLLTVRCIDLAYALPLDGLRTAGSGVRTVPCVHVAKHTYSDIDSFRSKRSTNLRYSILCFSNGHAIAYHLGMKD